MNAALIESLEPVRGAWRFRWPALAIAWSMCVIGWLGVLAIPNVYEARSRLFVDTRTVLKPVLQGLTVDQDESAEVNYVRQVLMSGPQMQRVASAVYPDFAKASVQRREEIVDALRDQVQLDMKPTSEKENASGSIYTIHYQSGNRARALQIVQMLVHSFVGDTLHGKQSGSDEAQRFLRQRIGDYEQRLHESESRLADFKRQHIGAMPGTQGDYFARLQNEVDAQKKAEAALAMAINRRDERERQLRGDAPFITNAGETAIGKGAGASAAGSDTMMRIRETQSKIDELLLKFTDRHPEVIAMKETLEDLKQRRQQEIEALQRGDRVVAASSGASSNPVYQNIQLALNQAEVEIAELRAQIREHTRNVADLSKVVDTMPQIEAQLARLNRDYDVTKAQYTSLVERLEKARLGGEAGPSGLVRFEIVDPPSVGFEPVTPNRPRLLMVVLVVGLGMGGGLAYLLNMLRPVFTSTVALKSALGLPLLGEVSMIWRDERDAKAIKSNVLYATATATLVLLFGASMLLHQAGSQLLHKMGAQLLDHGQAGGHESH